MPSAPRISHICIFSVPAWLGMLPIWGYLLSCVKRVGSVSVCQSDHFFQRPDMIGHAGGHRGRDPKRLVDAAEVVPHEMDGYGVSLVFGLLGKAVTSSISLQPLMARPITGASLLHFSASFSCRDCFCLIFTIFFMTMHLTIHDDPPACQPLTNITTSSPSKPSGTVPTDGRSQVPGPSRYDADFGSPATP